MRLDSNTTLIQRSPGYVRARISMAIRTLHHADAGPLEGPDALRDAAQALEPLLEEIDSAERAVGAARWRYENEERERAQRRPSTSVAAGGFGILLLILLGSCIASLLSS